MNYLNQTSAYATFSQRFYKSISTPIVSNCDTQMLRFPHLYILDFSLAVGKYEVIKTKLATKQMVGINFMCVEGAK